MSKQSPVKWHEIINEREEGGLPFLDLYREFAEAVKEREAQKVASSFWPYPK